MVNGHPVLEAVVPANRQMTLAAASTRLGEHLMNRVDPKNVRLHRLRILTLRATLEQ